MNSQVTVRSKLISQVGYICFALVLCTLFMLMQLQLFPNQLNSNIEEGQYGKFLQNNKGKYAVMEFTQNAFQAKDSFRKLSQDLKEVTGARVQSENRPQGKMAYFLLMSQNEREKVVNLFKKIIAPQNIYLIHTDKKMDLEELQNVTADIQKLNETYHNFYFLPQYQVSYLGIASIDIELTAMAYALSISMHWTHYMIISPSDYPLLTQHQISTILSYLPQNASFLEAKLMTCGNLDYRIKKFRFDTAIAGQSDNRNKEIPYKVPIPQNLKILKGSQWKLLSREMVKYFVYSEDGWARRMLLFFAGSYIPTEHYYETTACNSPSSAVKDMVRIGEVTFKSWHNIDWEERKKAKGTLGPNNMNQKYLKWALNQGRFFARKFKNDQEGQNLKDLLDRLHDGEEIIVSNATFTKEKVFKKTAGYLKWIARTSNCSQFLDQQQKC